MGKDKNANSTISDGDMARVRRARQDRWSDEIRKGTSRDWTASVGQQVLAGKDGRN